MFRGKTAWFSSSVRKENLDFWTLESGTVAHWRKADYLFSEDAACPDTQRIFESKHFLWNKVTVFHSLFLSTCEKRQSVKSVCIGHYVLPPASVQDEVRNVVGRLIWECDDEESEAEVRASNNTDFFFLSFCGFLPAVSVNMDNLQKYSGHLCDFHPGCFRCARCQVLCDCSQHTCILLSSIVRRLVFSVWSAEKTIGASLSSIQDLYLSRVRKRAGDIAADPSHPAQTLFKLLPSGRRYRSLQARTTRLRNSFFPQAVTLMNSK
ncbi:telomere repeats-binding bouquet formation protein 2 [Salarias fasciatus]|uniref:telomere repeats-binding bouquet formation protein 2 n=1 Tax=Salarias fasciatus TaxID=181472 RepID=UPI00117650C4|nr:telomere repeats-binding bouquet formation protein 2 [Salarias fasciatus]